MCIIKSNLFVWNWSNAVDIRSALWILMAWCFSTRASVATMLNMNPVFPVIVGLFFFKIKFSCLKCFINVIFIPPPNEVGGGYTGFTLSFRLSVCPSVRPSVCRRHGFRSISQVCFGISISNFICMLMVAIGRNLLIFSDVTFKMAAWRPYWIFWFPDSNFTLALNINFKLKQHNTYVYG